MFKPLALFAPLYFVDLLALHIVAPASVATQFHWCYPLVAAVAVMLTGMVVRPTRPLVFSLAALPLVYLLSFVRFVGETVWYLGFDTLRQMHGTMLPMMLAQLRENLTVSDVALMLANVILVFLALFWGARRRVMR